MAARADSFFLHDHRHLMNVRQQSARLRSIRNVDDKKGEHRYNVMKANHSGDTCFHVYSS